MTLGRACRVDLFAVSQNFTGDFKDNPDSVGVASVHRLAFCVHRAVCNGLCIGVETYTVTWVVNKG